MIDINELQIFKNEKFGQVRTIYENGTILFCGKDVAIALGYKDTTNAMKQHCRGVVKRHLTDSLGRERETNFIPLGDIYRLAAKSELPGATEFESWIFDDVLPTIQRHGAYMTPETLEEAILNPDTIIKIATALKEEKDKNKILKVANSELTVEKQIMQPKAEYFDELVDRHLLTNFRDTAKELHIGQREFVSFLIKHKYIYRDKKGNLKPYADKQTDLFEVKETFNEKTNWNGTQTLITPKGRETFRLLMAGA